MSAVATLSDEKLNLTEAFLESVLPREITIVPRPDGEGNISLSISIRESNGDRVYRSLYGIEAQQMWAAVDRARVAKSAKRRST